jgi:hypothetical protein
MTLKSFLNFSVVLVLVASCNNGSGTASDSAGAAADSSSVKDAEGFVRIFDGKTFTGWEGDTAYWRVDSGAFIGEEHPDKELKANTFLIWRGGTPGDFEFKAEYRISGGGNSGVQYRSDTVAGVPLGLKGYQADIDGANQYTGQNYEERGRGFLAMRGQKVTLASNAKPLVTDSLGNADSLKMKIKDSTQWNAIYIIAKGNHMQHFINGVLMSEATDNDSTARKFTGLIGLQLHVMPYMKVEYRNIRLKQD